MKKLVVAAAVLAVGAGGYYLSQNQAGISQDEVLANIPADTVLFSGQFTPFPYKDYILATAGSYQQFNTDEFADLDDISDPSERFIFSLLLQYTKTIANPVDLLALYGLPDSGKSYLYSLGLVPVLKIELANPAAFWQELDRAEAESGYSHTSKTHQDINYRAYSLVDEGEEGFVDIVMAEQNGWLTVTLNSSFNQPELLSQAFGLTAVDNPITDTTLIADTLKKHGFISNGLSFLNHEQIVTGMTTTDGNLLAKHLAKFAQLTGKDEFSDVKSATCRQELQGIAANWPKTVMGLRQFDVSPQQVTMNSQLVVESNNAVIMGALQKMRGFIPSVVKQDSILALGLGVDVNQVAPALNQIWNDLLTPSYQCEGLAHLQGQIEQQNPMMLAMATGMANGVKGMSVTVNDYSLTEQYGQPSIGNLDALVTLSADNPMMLIDMVKPFYPPLANISLTQDGDAVDVSSMLMLPPSMGIKAKLAVKGQHMVLFSGEKAQAMANKVASESLSANGLVSMTMDYEKALTPLLGAIESSGQMLPEELGMLSSYDMKVSSELDVTANGIMLNLDMTTKAAN